MNKTFLLFFSYIITFNTVLAEGGGENNISSGANFIRGILMSETIINFIFALLVLVGTVILSKYVRSLLEKYLVVDSSDTDDTSKEEVFGVISRTVNIGVWVIGLSVAMGVMGLDIALFMGGIGFGIGFTMQVFLSNFISGVIIVLQGTFKTGDKIDMGGKIGTIKKINTLFTQAEQLDGVRYYIPNLKFLQEDVSNFSANDKRRLDIELNLDKETDIVKAKKIIINVLDSFPNVLKSPESEIWVTDFEDGSIKIKVMFWLSSSDQIFVVRSNIVETINLAFKQAGIILPFKQLTISNRESK